MMRWDLIGVAGIVVGASSLAILLMGSVGARNARRWWDRKDRGGRR